MFIKLEEKQTDLLLSQTESGMGYQIVEVTTKWLKKEAVVFNAEVLIYLDDKESFQYFSQEKSFDKIKKYATVSTDIIDLKVIKKQELKNMVY